MKNENKITQGRKKIRQHLEDLKRNQHFQSLLKTIRDEIEKNQRKEWTYKPDPKWDEVINNFQTAENAMKLYLSQETNIINETLKQIAFEYGIEFAEHEDLSTLNERIYENIYDYDMCRIADNFDEFVADTGDGHPITFMFDAGKQIHYRAFPISIDINKMASKRDILDFIDKKWDMLEEALTSYREKAPRFRERKLDRAITDLIWENKDLSTQEIKEKLNQNFPNHTLMYDEILKLKSIESKRRQKDYRIDDEQDYEDDEI